MPTNPLSNDILASTSVAASQFTSVVARLANGSFVILWGEESPSTGEVRARLFDAAGAALTGEILVNTTTAGLQWTPSVSAFPGGGFVAVYESGLGPNGDILGQRFDANGQKVGPEFIVTNVIEEQLFPKVTTLAGGGFVVTWETIVGGTYDDIRARLYDSSGNPVGGAFVANTNLVNEQFDATVASLEGGGFVVVWRSEPPAGLLITNIAAQRFDANGNKLGGEFQVNTGAATEPQSGADVVGLPGGGFVISWIAPKDGFDTGSRVLARRYDANGVAVGGEIVVDDTGSGFSQKSAIAASPDGGFIVSWKDVQANGDETFLTARAFDASGSPLGTRFVVNQTANDGLDNNNETVAVQADGSVVFTWVGEGPGDEQGAFFRRFDVGFAAAAGGGTGGNDELTGTAGNDTLDGLGGNDSILAQQGGDDQLSGGEGNDGLFFGSAMTSADGADGGAGTDTLGLQGNYAGLNFGNGVVNIDVIYVAPGNDTRFGDNGGNFYDYVITTVDPNVAAGAILTVVGGNLRPGEDLTFNGSAESDGHFRIFAGQSVDTLTGGAGNDGFYFGANRNLTGADRINGGAGNDTIALRGNYIDLGAVIFQDDSFTSIEVLTFLSGHTNEFGGFIDLNGFVYSVILANGNIAPGQRLDIIATNLRSNESISVDARLDTDGSVRILAGAGDDNMLGTAGNDILYGGLGADRFFPVAGNDTILYHDVAESTAASRDSISFTPGDKIDLSAIDADGTAGSADAFTYIGANPFTNVAGQLRSFVSAGVQLIEGDVNGDGVADLVIQVTGATIITAGDFIL